MNDYQKVFNFQVELNDVCNLTCKHCYQIRSKVKDELDIDLVLKQAKELNEAIRFPSQLFRLSGGEPLLRKDIFQIIRKISENGHYVELITNGTLIDLPTAFALKASGVLFCQISLDGSTPEIHETIRGKGSFKKTINGIKNLLKADIPVEIKFTLIKGINTNDIQNMFNLCHEIGVKYISIGRFIFTGHGKDITQGNLIGNELKDVFYKIINIGSEFPELEIKIRDVLARIISDIETPSNVRIQEKDFIGVNYLAIDTYGNVFAERQMDIILGNIHKKSLLDIWTKSRKLKQLKGGLKYLRGKCKTCSINTLCLGGNKSASYGLTGSPFEPDPGCWLD